MEPIIGVEPPDPVEAATPPTCNAIVRADTLQASHEPQLIFGVIADVLGSSTLWSCQDATTKRMPILLTHC
jgi:hypothetical protein